MNILSRFTLRSLMKNKTRTLVTVIGIALSVSMFTAVTSIIVSFQDYMLQVEIDTYGAWEGQLRGCSQETVDMVVQDHEVKSYTEIANLGYANLEDCDNEDKPYLFVAGIGEDFTDLSSITLMEGRMPENDTELLLPRHLALNGGVEYQVGDTLKLQLGYRVYRDGDAKGMWVGGQQVAFRPEDVGGEKLVTNTSKTYTVVGICERPVVEDYTAPGYTAFTLDNGEGADSYDVMMTFRNPSQAQKLLEKYSETAMDMYGEALSYTTHGDLLRYKGKSTNERYNFVLYSMGGILMTIIMIGSVSLIYNAFSISVSERTKQFGLLKSIGATKKQMRHSVLFEACVLSIAGIPLGIIAGLGGIGVTLHYIGTLFSRIWARDATGDVVLKLVVTWQSLVIAALLGFVTVLVSALIPAHKAVKLTALQAIRQNMDVRIRPEKVRTSGLVYRLFGFEAMLASKNFKRSRKKQRATVFSLFISIVLFITATSFSGYLQLSRNAVVQARNYDISYSMDDGDMGTHTQEDIAQDSEALTTVDKVGYCRVANAFFDIPIEYLAEDYRNLLQNQGDLLEDQEDISIAAEVCFVRDSVYRDYLTEEGLDVDTYMDTKKWTPLLWDKMTTYLEDGKYFTSHILKKTGWDVTLNLEKEIKGYFYREKQGDVYIFEDESDGSQKEMPVEKAFCQQEITLGQVQTGEAPLGIFPTYNSEMTMVLPYSAIEENQLQKAKVSMLEYAYFFAQAKNHQKAYEELSGYLSQDSFGSNGIASLYDEAEDGETEKILILILDVFSYGFIMLISLISIANVFNTISTNVQLRRQEFAMLKSVGMAGKGFDKMMNYECLLYGVKGLLYGVPVSLGISWWMYHVMREGWNVTYVFPWQGILTVTASVFIVVFATMLYSMSKIKKDNPIEALRDENL